ncbi:hypothetical protein J23TS9_56510 [Paenibacillus sp. J23TS9]|nr:hypothetical protein J23TS9_56510 [Paenibacillus sp. J23TS9]
MSEASEVKIAKLAQRVCKHYPQIPINNIPLKRAKETFGTGCITFRQSSYEAPVQGRAEEAKVIKKRNLIHGSGFEAFTRNGCYLK